MKVIIEKKNIDTFIHTRLHFSNNLNTFSRATINNHDLSTNALSST